MKQLYLFLFLSILTPSVTGQNTPVNNKGDLATQSNLFNLNSGNHVIQTFDDRYDGVKGNRYFYNDQYQTGLLMRLDSSIISQNAVFRFDQMSSQVQVKYANGREQVFEIYQILMLQLKIEGQDVVFVKNLIPNSTQEYRLLQVVYYSPTLKLFKDVQKKLVRVNETGAYSKGVIYDEIDNDIKHYLKRGDRTFTEVKPSRKSLSKALPDMQKQINRLFDLPTFKDDLTTSKLAALMKQLDEVLQERAKKE